MFRHFYTLAVFGFFVFVSLGSLHAQNSKLIDSVKNIFRANPENALQIIDIIQISSQSNAIKIEALIIKGNILYFKGQHDAALKIYLKALKDAEVSKLYKLASHSCNEIGTLFKKNKDLNLALDYYKRAKIEAERGKDLNQLANSLNNIGLIYEELGNYNLALAQYQKSLDYYRRAGDKLGESYSLEYIGYVYGLMRNYTPALKNLQNSLEIRLKLNDNYGIAIALIELSEVCKNKGSHNLASTYARQAIAAAEKSKYPDMVQNGYLLLSEILEAQNQYSESLKYYKYHIKVKDSLFNAMKSEQIAKLQVAFNSKEQNQQIKLLDKQNTIQQLKIGQKNAWIIGMLVCFILVVGTVALLYRSNKLKQEAKLQSEILIQQDLATKAILNAEENERKRISGELHDGIGQMFSTVKMNLSAIAEDLSFNEDHNKQVFDKTLGLVDESCAELRTIAHQMAPNVLLKSGLASAVKDFVQKIDSRRLKVNLETVGLNERLEQNVETVLYRVLQETVNNVIKHAKASQLDIQLVKEDDCINVMVEDNGNGFDTSKIEKFEGIGLKNIKTRIGYLKGTIDFSSKPGLGTLVAIYIPII